VTDFVRILTAGYFTALRTTNDVRILIVTNYVRILSAIMTLEY